MYRIKNHPIIDRDERREITFYFEGKKLYAKDGEVISSALIANGIKIFSYHKKDNSPQGIFCANGQCAQCSVVADGMVVKACVTQISENMNIETLKGVGKINLRLEKDFKLSYSKIDEIDVDVLIVGGGPSGLSSAVEIGKFNIDVLLIDDKDRLGGKLLLQTHKFFGSVDDCYAGMRGIDIAEKLLNDVLKYPSIKIWNSATCFGVFSDKKIAVIKNNICYLIKPKVVIFATGAREKNLLFEGNTLPGVYGAGAFQTLVNRDGVKASQRLFVVGGGNVGLIAAYHAIQSEIKVVGLCEISKKCGGYKVHEDKIKRLGVPIYTSHTILKVEGNKCVERVVICEVDENYRPIKGREKVFNVDSVLIACGLNPVNELYEEAVSYQIPSFICGDAQEIAEASAAIFSGKITAHKVLKHLGFVTNDVPNFWIEKLEILKSRPGRTFQEIDEYSNKTIYPKIHCMQEIPCNPCVSVCPKKSIKLSGQSIMDIPKFDGECIGCFKCVLICPGLAITLIDKREDSENPIVWIPLEININISKGEKVIGVDSSGRMLGEFDVYDIKNFSAEKTKILGIKTNKNMCDRVVSIKILDDEKFLKYCGDIKSMSDDIVICRCEKVTLGEIRKWIKKGVRDMNQLKAITRLAMGACGSKTCGSLILSVMREEGIDVSEITMLTKRPPFIEIEFSSIAGINKKTDDVKDSFSNF